MNKKVDKGKLNDNTKKVKEVPSTTVNKEGFKCDQCNFKSNKEITLSKHINTKHAQQGTEDITKHIVCNSLEFECTLYKDRFNTRNDLDRHKSEHIEQIENIDIESLTNGHDIFECNLFSFESGHEDSVKEHLIQHVNCPKDETGYEGSVNEHTIEHGNATIAVNTNKDATEKEKSNHRLIDEYDDDGNYIGDDPKYMQYTKRFKG